MLTFLSCFRKEIWCYDLEDLFDGFIRRRHCASETWIFLDMIAINLNSFEKYRDTFQFYEFFCVSPLHHIWGLGL